MKTYKILLSTLSFLLFSNLFAQQNLNDKLLKINKKIDSVVQVKSRQFEADLKHIDEQLKNKKISRKEAEANKKRLAKQYAEDLDFAIYKLTGDLKRVSNKYYIIDSIFNERTTYRIRKVKLYNKKHAHKKVTKKRNSHSYLFLSTGLNNIIDKDKVESLEFSPYGYIQSRFFEIGIDRKTNLLHHKAFLTYGFSFIWNTLKPTGNNYHVVTNDTVQIAEYPHQLERSKLRHIWLRLPVSLEFNLPSAYKRHLHVSAGVYGKFRLTTKQKLTYFSNGDSHDEVLKNDYLMPNFAYGLTGSIGGSSWTVYTNYDLTPLFKNSSTHLISLGLKWRL